MSFVPVPVVSFLTHFCIRIRCRPVDKEMYFGGCNEKKKIGTGMCVGNGTLCDILLV